jgi:hypothetical protein
VTAATRASQFGTSATTASAGESITLATVTVDPSGGEYVALSASAWNLVIESDATNPDTGEAFALSIGWIQAGGAECAQVPVGEDGPLPPTGMVPGSELPLMQGFVGPASGSTTVGLQVVDDPVVLHLCSSVLLLFGGEVVEYGSAGLTAVQSSSGAVSGYTP